MVRFLQYDKLTAPAEAEAETVAFQVLTPDHVHRRQSRPEGQPWIL
jgi:hypothetical protein